MCFFCLWKESKRGYSDLYHTTYICMKYIRGNIPLLFQQSLIHSSIIEKNGWNSWRKKSPFFGCLRLLFTVSLAAAESLFLRCISPKTWWAWKKTHRPTKSTQLVQAWVTHLKVCNKPFLSGTPSPPSGATGCGSDCLSVTREVKTSISTHIKWYKGPSTCVALLFIAWVTFLFLFLLAAATTINFYDL